jgi:hypothetical protein|tara:strand:+ start:1118 stop:1468 length:351 start_codon:yes stop_codon:yes gene_type:complete
MFHIKRVWESKPGYVRQVATLAYKAAEHYNVAGQRGDNFSVYFNIGTTPGEKNIVVLAWTDDNLQSVMRGENQPPGESLKIWKALLEITEDNWIEFDEFLTSDKMVDVSKFISDGK